MKKKRSLLTACAFFYFAIGLTAYAQFSAGEISEELPKWAVTWLDDKGEAILRPKADALRKQLSSDAELKQKVRLQIEKFKNDEDYSPAMQAAMLDIIGEYGEAFDLYRKMVDARKKSSITISKHLIRILHIKKAQLALEDKKREVVRYSVEELTFSLPGQPHFEDGIALLEELTAYLKNNPPEELGESLSWVKKIEQKFSSFRFGDVLMPPIWAPQDLPVRFKGLPPWPEEIELRQDTYWGFCREALRFPGISAWAFSRLAAMSDLQGNFKNNDELLAQAKFAILTDKIAANFGSIPPGYVQGYDAGKLKARFHSPDLYLAYHYWKHPQDVPDDLPEGVRDRFDLLACEATDFMKLANELIRKNIPDDSEQVMRGLGKEIFTSDYLTQRFSEVLKIWEIRDCDARIIKGLMQLEKELVKKRYFSVSQSELSLIRFLDLTARHRDPGKVDEALEKLASVYLGPPDQRAEALKILPSEGEFVNWVPPPPVRYVDLLKKMVFYPSLIFPAHRKATEIGVANRIITRSWIQRKDVENHPSRVIEKLKWSPLMEDLPDFRLLATASYEFMNLSYDREATIFGNLVKIIRELPPKQQKLYRDYFTSQKSFGVELMLAALAKNQGEALQDFLKSKLEVIRKQEEIFKQELALFALPKLPKSGSGEIEEVISGTFPKANKARLEVLEKRIRNESMLASNSDRSQLLALILQNDPDEAFETLRRVAAIIKERGPIDDYEKQAFLRRDFSWLFDFLRDVRYHLKDERVFYKFYLRVLADAKLGKGLFIDDLWLTPKFDMGNGPEAEQKQFEQGLLWAAENLPDSLPAEYLIFSSIGRWGWVSSTGRPGVSTDEFLQRVGKNFSGEQRKMIAASLILGKNNVEWRFRDLSEPGWKDPAVAEAFVEMGKRIANEKLPFNLRLALAREICDNCQFHTPMDLRLSFARLLAQAWEEDVQVKGGEEDSILHLFVYGGRNPEWAEVADRLLKAWRNRIEKMDGEYGEVIQLYSQSPGWLVGLAAARGDEGNLNWLLGARWEKNLASTPLEPLSALIREGEVKRALRYAQNSSEYFIRKKNANRRVLFDRQLAKHLPDFLGKIEDLEFRAVLAAYIAFLEADHFDPEMPVKEERILAVAKSVGELDFKNTEYRNAVLTFIGKDSAAAAQLTEKYIAAARINDLKAVFKSKEKYSWKFIAHPMIVGLVAAGEYDHALEVLKKIAAQTEAKNQSYDRIWEVLSDAVSDGVTLCQNDPNKLAGMLEITSYMAALSDQRIPSVRTRAANYARNIYSHARVDRMEEWQDWRRGLDPEVRKKLDRDWFKKSGWAINLTATRMPHDAPVGQRIALMQAMLSLPEIIGKSGSLYSHAMTNLQKSGLFDADEFLLHGEAVASVIPDGGHAWRALADLAKKNGDAENAARFLKEAEKMGE
ncbi:MAG: hypothetical protein QM496_10525 [Verrucomicrobiota bacterium]